MRIASLLPSATEILFALDRGPQVVGVTHECDHPAGAQNLPILTTNLLGSVDAARDIDDAVAASVRDRHTIYRLDEIALAAADPDLVVTQSLCEVCAVPALAVHDALCSMPRRARIVESNPTTLAGVMESILSIAEAANAEPRGRQLVADLSRRLDRVATAVAARPRPRVAVVEWPDPVFAPGHWIPDMVASAGGINVLGASGRPSRRIPMEALVASQADVIVLGFCGYGLHDTQVRLRELAALDGWAEATRHARLLAVDGSAYFSRPGPRLVDGVELLAWALHRPAELRPAVRLGAELIEAGWVDVASFSPTTAAL